MFRETPGGSGSLLAGEYYLKKKNKKINRQTIRKLVVSLVHVCTSVLVKLFDVRADGRQLHEPNWLGGGGHTHPLDRKRCGM